MLRRNLLQIRNTRVILSRNRVLRQHQSLVALHAKAATEWQPPSTGQQQPSKTTSLFSVTDVKGLLQVAELKLTNSSGTSTKALVLCDAACSNSWVSDSPAARLGLQGTALKLTVKGINTKEIIDTKVVQLTVTPHKDQDFEAFTVRPYVKETLDVGSDIFDVKSMQEITHIWQS